MDNQNSHITALNMHDCKHDSSGKRNKLLKVQSCAGRSKTMVDLLLQMNWRAFVVTRLMTLQIMLEYADTLTL